MLSGIITYPLHAAACKHVLPLLSIALISTPEKGTYNNSETDCISLNQILFVIAETKSVSNFSFHEFLNLLYRCITYIYFFLSLFVISILLNSTKNCDKETDYIDMSCKVIQAGINLNQIFNTRLFWINKSNFQYFFYSESDKATYCILVVFYNNLCNPPGWPSAEVSCQKLHVWK